MRIWFAEGPAYSRRTEALFAIICLAAYVGIGAVLALLGAFPESLRWLAAFGISSVLALLFRLLLRMRARENGVPFVPVRELRTQRRAWLREKRAVGSALAEGLCTGILIGLATAQVKGRPFWESDLFGWAAIIATAFSTVAFEVLKARQVSLPNALAVSGMAFFIV